MSSLLQGGQRRRPRRRRRRAAPLLALLLAAALVLGVFELRPGDNSQRTGRRGPAPLAPAVASAKRVGGDRFPRPPAYGRVPAAPARRLRIAFKHPPTAALLWDVNTGQVLFSRHATRRLRIASLTKMMTALVVNDRVAPRARVLITRAAVTAAGSSVGLLPRGKRVAAEALLYGLLLPSGNDAATALAQHAGGSVPHFVELMNRRARRMRMTCTHFSTPSGLRDRGNASCASDLALLAHAVLARPRLARIVRAREAVVPFPIKGHKLFLFNNNPLLRLHYRGADGVKTGYTDAAGRCLVATARRGNRWLGVVLLHSPDPPGQAQRMLDRGFAR